MAMKLMTTNGHAFAHGTISHGTLRTEDLLRAFLPEVDHYYARKPECYYDAQAWLEGPEKYAIHYETDIEDSEFQECGTIIVSYLMDALDSLCPEGTYFGSHCGDGSDFGFWPCEED